MVLDYFIGGTDIDTAYFELHFIPANGSIGYNFNSPFN